MQGQIAPYGTPPFFEGENKPKSVIRRAESVFDWESEAFGHLARLCPQHAPRYAST